MAATPNLPYEVRTKRIGKLLQEEYGTKDPNTPINYFMVLLGQQISSMLDDSEKLLKDSAECFKASLEQLGMHVGRVNDDGWTARKLIFIEFNDPFSNERERENALNKKVREALKKEYEQEVDTKLLPGTTDVHIIFSRACLYYKEDSPPQQQPNLLDQQDQKLPLITTEKIGSTLKNEYSIGDTPIDYFYLFIHVEENEKPQNVQESTASSFLKDLPGEWRILDEVDWPGVYIGHYPKTSGFMTEREREMSLNEKVREPLIKKMQPRIREMLKQASEPPAESEAKVHVIITRACEYNKKETYYSCLLV